MNTVRHSSEGEEPRQQRDDRQDVYGEVGKVIRCYHKTVFSFLDFRSNLHNTYEFSCTVIEPIIFQSDSFESGA